MWNGKEAKRTFTEVFLRYILSFVVTVDIFLKIDPQQENGYTDLLKCLYLFKTWKKNNNVYFVYYTFFIFINFSGVKNYLSI